MNRHVVVLTAACGSLIPCLQSFGQIEVLFNQIAGHSKALVPAGSGLPVGTEFFFVTQIGFDRPYASPDGTKIFFTGRAGAPAVAADDECFILLDGNTATTVAREGTTIGAPNADLVGPGPQRMAVNDAGHFTFGYNTASATTLDDYIVKWDGASFVTIARDGDAVSGFAGEVLGSTLQSPNILANGTVAYVAGSTVGPLATSQDDFCFVGNTVLIQHGVTPIGAFTWDVFNTSDLWVTSDNAHWLMVGDDTNPTTAQDKIVAVDGNVVVREGVVLPGSGFADPVQTGFTDYEIILCDDGAWIMRGHNNGAPNHDWVVRNGTVIAQKGAPITTGNPELYDDTTFANLFFFIAGNAVGDYVVGGLTNAVDLTKNAVLVLNDSEVVAREGDMVDLNGNGIEDDDAFLGVFNNDDGVLTDDLVLVFFADVVNGAGTSLGQMVLRKDLNQPLACPADIAPPGGDDVVNVQDLLAVIAAWGACVDPKDCPADIAPPGGDDVVNVQDLLAVIAAWGACP